MASKGGGGSLFRYADGIDKLLMLFGTLGSIGDGLMSPLTMYILAGVIDEYGAADLSFSNKVVDKYTFRLLYVAVVVGVSAFIEGICWTRTAERQTSRIRTEYLKSVLRQEVGFFDNPDSTSTTFRVVSTISSDAHSIQDVMAEKIPNCLAHSSSFIFGMAAAFLLSWRMALTSLPFSLGFIIPGVGFGKLMMNQGMKMKDAYGVAGGIAEQAISSIRTVYAYVGEHQTLDRFGQALESSMNLGIKKGFTKGLVVGSMGMVYAAWAFESWAGSILVTENGESGGRVFVSAVCIILGGLSCMSALPNLSFISDARAAAVPIFEMIDRIPGVDCEDGRGNIMKHVRGEIEFKEVSFNYPSRPDTPILQGLNLKVKAGKTIGLVGESGSGKSTIISLLERFYDPVKGEVLLDGYKIKGLRLKWLRSLMGLVNQEPILFATSIKENILFGNEEASMDLVIRAAKAANAHSFILALPNGYETQVGQYGIQLSGGQKQRIAIARALIKDPRILLLDEATSALDAESEKIVQEALDQASVGRTTIIIAHRLATIHKADKVVVLQSGRVVESGSHDELMQISIGGGGVYFRMVQLQQAATQKEVICSPNHPAEGRNNQTIRNGQPRKNPTANRLSWEDFSASTFSTALSMGRTPSIQLHSYIDSDDASTEKSSCSRPSQWHLLQMNAPEWKRGLLGCLGAVGFGAIQPVYAYCLGSIVAVFFVNNNQKIKSETKFYSIIFLCLAALSFVANLLQHYNFAIMGERLTKRLREKMLEKIFTFEIGWFDEDENTSAAICGRLATEANMVRTMIGDRLQLLVQVSTSACLAFLFGLLITWRVAIIMISMQPLLIASFYYRSVLMKRMSEKAQSAQNEGSQLASEAVINHRTITAFSSQERILGLFAATLKGPRKESIKQSWLSGMGLFTAQFLTTASIALTYWYGGRLMNHGLVTSKQLFQVFFILMSTGKSIADTGSMTSDLAKGGSAITSLFTILERRSEIDPEELEGFKVKSTVRGKIELKNVFFSYPSRPEQMIFQGLSLEIVAGRTKALVGQSGSGKSTVISLIERFYDPTKGSVLIDHQDIKSYNLRQLRSNIALVSQEPTLFSGTIRQNIAYGKEDATEAEIRKAAMLANANEFISSMKDGYQTDCGERGVQLSGGQKQRIALARAILKNPAILLLDEATSAMDSISENLVQQALDKMMVGRTCVVVAHRLSTVQRSDSIAVIKNGKVVEEGSHSELLALGNHGSYHSLVKLQKQHLRS